jgi:hypothetical protein
MDMSDPHGRVRDIDMLAARSAGAIRIYPQILIIDVHLDLILHFRIGKNRSKGSMTPAAGIIGRNAHQAVDAVLCFHVTVGIGALHRYGGSLDPGLLTILVVQYLGPETAPLSPAQIHAEQHLGPILGLRATCPGVDADDSVPCICLVTQKRLQFEGIQCFLNLLKLLDRFREQFLSQLSIFLDQFQRSLQISQRRFDPAEPIGLVLQKTDPSGYCLCLCGIVPEIR